MTEQEYRNKIDPFLNTYFELDAEVKSQDKTSRIDYVLRCRQSGKLFGLEVKKKDIQQGSKMGKYLKQALRYSTKTFKSKFGNGIIPIFITPAISSVYKEFNKEHLPIQIKGREYRATQHSDSHEHSNINSLIGEVANIGELRLLTSGDQYKVHFIFSFRNKTIWRSNRFYANSGRLKIETRLHEKNYENMLKTISK